MRMVTIKQVALLIEVVSTMLNSAASHRDSIAMYQLEIERLLNARHERKQTGTSILSLHALKLKPKSDIDYEAQRDSARTLRQGAFYVTDTGSEVLQPVRV